MTTTLTFADHLAQYAHVVLFNGTGDAVLAELESDPYAIVDEIVNHASYGGLADDEWDAFSDWLYANRDAIRTAILNA